MRCSSMKLSKIVEKWMKRKKGHFPVYTKNGKRFVVPIYYLNRPIFKVLLETAKEEFGAVVNGPSQVPSEEELMDCILSLLRRNPSTDVEKVLFSMSTSCKGDSMSNFFPRFHAQESRGLSECSFIISFIIRPHI